MPLVRVVLLFAIGHLSLARKGASRPNIVLMITDDQDIELGSMLFMPKTVHLMKDRGVAFDSGYVSTPICCPSRSSILTGMYVHNHHVYTNNQNCSGASWRKHFEKKTFAVYAKSAGYRTGYFGKYLNEYDGSYIPPGWDHWMGLLKNSRFYNYSINFNGEKIKHGFIYEQDYFTDLIANDTIQFIHEHFERRDDKPFLAVLSFPAPHGPEDPAPQFAEWFEDVETHRTKSWNYAPNPDKQWLLQHTGRMEPIHIVFTDVLHRRRLQTLQSVDHCVQRLFNEVRDFGELSNTYFIYTSDHGYHLGQFGLVKGKNMPYEFDIHVPFFIRGPALPRNQSIKVPVSNVDIAPTILDMAGIEQPSHMDGRSLLQAIYDHERRREKLDEHRQNSSPWRHTILIERGKMAKMKQIRVRLQRQKDRFGRNARVEMICNRPEFSDPCTEEQEWKCVRNTKEQWQVYKCHDSVSVSKECVCEGNSKRKRNQRSNFIPRADLDKYGVKVHLSNELLKLWKNEFMHYIQQKEIPESGEWFQGVFDGMENSRKRSIQQTTEEQGSGRNLSIRPMCTRTNKSILCQSILFENSKAWTIQKERVDDRIENLRRKLFAFKNVRRVMKRYQPSSTIYGPTPMYDRIHNCQCSNPEADISRDLDQRKRIQKDLERFSSHGYAENMKKWMRTDAKQNCNVPKMNCFAHYADHWKTPPLWPALYGEFCFCQNSNNNTYWCLRTINETHNYLYCEFITEFVSYYDLNEDPSQLHNAIWSIPIGVLEELSKQLRLLRNCKGWKECEHYSSSAWNTPFMP